MGVSSISSVFLTTTGPQVQVVSPQTAIANIQTTVAQLDVAGGVSLSREGQLEQQLVKQISAANPSANQAAIAVVANDLNGPTSSTQITNDLNALIRMVQPTTGVTNITNTINAIAQLVRIQNTASTAAATPPPPIATHTVATAGPGATTLTLSSVSGMTAGDSIEVELDTQQLFNTSIASINTATNTVTLETGLPSQASQNNSITDLPGIATYTSTIAGAPPAVPAGSSTLTLTSTGGMSIGDIFQVLLDNQNLFTTQVTGINGNVVTFAQPLPFAAGGVNNYIADQTNPFTTVNQNAALGGNAANTITYIATTNSPVPPTTSAITLDTVGGMSVGDTLQIALDSGATFTTTINNIDPITLTVTLAQALPSSATLAGNVTDTVQLFPTAAPYSASAQMATLFDLQINDLIQSANSTVGLSQLTKDIAALSNPLLTNATFQQALATLNKLWTSTLPANGNATISVLA
jgi:hypothetical protein